MPQLTLLVIAGGAWLLLLLFVCALCVAAGRGDGRDDRAGGPSPGRRLRAQRPALVADTGGIRAHLRAASGLLAAEQLSVTVDIDGTEAVIASSRPVVEARAGAWPELATPVRVGPHAVATLRAVRRPGAPPFDRADRMMLDALAARVANSMEAARTGGSVAAEGSSAMA